MATATLTFTDDDQGRINVSAEFGAAIDPASLAHGTAQTMLSVMSAINTLATESHEFQSVFVDSLDWLEPLILAKVCRENGVDNIEKIGYGKGYIMADDLWRKFFAGLDGLRDTRSMTIVCIAHEQVKKMRNPTLAEDYDAYSLKLDKRAVAIINEWADVIGFPSRFCALTDHVVPPPEVQRDGCPAWEYDEIPF